MPKLQSEAQALLTEASTKEITVEEATRLVGHPLAVGSKYCLVRGVILFEATGSFSVGINESSIHVHHGCLGRRTAEMSRKAIVVVLPFVPKTVFVSCSMAE